MLKKKFLISIGSHSYHGYFVHQDSRGLNNFLCCFGKDTGIPPFVGKSKTVSSTSGHRPVVTKVCNIRDYFKSPIKQIACGYSHVLVCLKNGLVYGFGTPSHLGIDNNNSANNPKKEFVKLQKIKDCVDQVSCGNYHSTVLTQRGKVYMLGRSVVFGNFSTGRPYKVKIIGNKRIDSIADGCSFMLCLSCDKEVFIIGSLGGKKHNLATKMNCGGEKIIKVCGGEYFAIVLSISGKVYGMGKCGSGNLTSEYKTDQTSFQYISKLSKHKIIDIEVGADHVLAMTSSNQLCVWGYNYYNNIGIKNVKDKGNSVFEPRILRNPCKNIVQIECGYNCTYLFDQNSDVWVCGDNKYGTLVTGTLQNVVGVLTKSLISGRIRRISNEISLKIKYAFAEMEFPDSLVIIKLVY